MVAAVNANERRWKSDVNAIHTGTHITQEGMKQLINESSKPPELKPAEVIGNWQKLGGAMGSMK